MTPLWIIDLEERPASVQHLQQLIAALPQAIQGHWHYSHVACPIVRTVDDCRSLMGQLVEEGRTCYNRFTQQGYRMDNFQIALLGVADQEMTQSVYAALGGLLRDALPRIVAEHANLGVEITGLLFVPYRINQSDDAEGRLRTAMLLEELNTIVEEQRGIMFSRIVLYQDVQYAPVRAYPHLSDSERIELLFQYLSNIYLCGAGSPTLFDEEYMPRGMCCLGAAAVHYDPDGQRRQAENALLQRLLDQLRDEDNADIPYARQAVRKRMDAQTLSASNIATRLREGCHSLDVDLRKIEEQCDPHPVWNLFSTNLLPLYYLKHLRFMPARTIRTMQNLSYALLTRFAATMRKNEAHLIDSFMGRLRGAYRQTLQDQDCRYTTLPQVKAFFSETKALLVEARAEVRGETLEIAPVPNYLRGDYDKCRMQANAGTRERLVERLSRYLKWEPVVLALMVRSFLLGVLSVFVGVPLLRILSPHVINIGDPARFEWLWVAILFLLPLAILMLQRLRRHFARVRRVRYRLLALTLVEVNAKLSALLAERICAVYDALMAECDSQMAIIDEWSAMLTLPAEDGGEGLPTTMFCQSLLEGSFLGKRLLTDATALDPTLRLVPEGSKHFSDLQAADLQAILKYLFRQPEIVATADLSQATAEELPERAQRLCAQWEEGYCQTNLEVEKTRTIARMIDHLSSSLDITPLLRIGALNGMLVQGMDDNRPIVRMSEGSRAMGEVQLQQDEGDTHNLFYTTWQALPGGVESRFVCNCALEALPPLSLADRLVLYYAYFRRKDLAYSLAGFPIHIEKEEMIQLDEELRMP